MGLALDIAEKTVLPILIEECKIPLRVRRLQYTDFRGDYASALNRLMQSLPTQGDVAPAAASTGSTDGTQLTDTPLHVATAISSQAEGIMDGYTKLQSSLARLQSYVSPARQWQSVGFDEATDNLLAELAADNPDAQVARSTALVCADIRSTTAALCLARKATTGHKGALRALAWIRDETPNLPADIPPKLRRRVFRVTTWNQFLEQPAALLGRYLGAALGFGIGLGVIVFKMYPTQSGIIIPEQFNSALALGIQYGLLTGLGILAATELAARLKAWTRPGRILVASAMGALITGAVFALFDGTLYERFPIGWLVFSSLMLASGFVISSALTRRLWLRMVTGMIGVFLAIYLPAVVDPSNAPLVLRHTDLTGRVDQSWVMPLSLWLAVIVGILTYLADIYNVLADKIRRRSVL